MIYRELQRVFKIGKLFSLFLVWKYRRFNVHDKSKFEQVLVPSISIFDLSIISPISYYQIRFSDKLIKYIDQTTDQIQQNFLISKSKSLGYF